jgi:hypothetical protein
VQRSCVTLPCSASSVAKLCDLCVKNSASAVSLYPCPRCLKGNISRSYPTDREQDTSYI